MFQYIPITYILYLKKKIMILLKLSTTHRIPKKKKKLHIGLLRNGRFKFYNKRVFYIPTLELKKRIDFPTFYYLRIFHFRQIIASSLSFVAIIDNNNLFIAIEY